MPGIFIILYGCDLINTGGDVAACGFDIIQRRFTYFPGAESSITTVILIFFFFKYKRDDLMRLAGVLNPGVIKID